MTKSYAGKELQKYNNLYREIDDFYHDFAVQSGLSDSALWILYTICEQGEGCLQRDICSAACVSKQTIHSAIHKLEQEGYLYLEAGKGHDKHIFLTEHGRTLAREKILPLIQMENAAFSDMGDEESQALLSLTEKYLKLLKAEAAGLTKNEP